MALIDFSNAVLHLPTSTSFYVLTEADAGLNGYYLYNSGGTKISTNEGCLKIKDEQYLSVLSYAGNFTASGTEFYLGSRSNISEKWKITGISFQSGDSYSFQIPINLICN